MSENSGAGTTIAIVTAFDNPTAETDLAIFSRQFGLHECTTENGCFTRANATSAALTVRRSWTKESALDIEWAHAIAPAAKILLVQARTNDLDDLLAAVDYATSRARYVSMGWGVPEFDGQSEFDPHFTRAGVSFFAASGDTTKSVLYPSASPQVLSIGGSTLDLSHGDLVRESVSAASGGGCSEYSAAPVAQSNFAAYGQTRCDGQRATPDLVFAADPGVAVYFDGAWTVEGGTSAATVMAAAAAADSGRIFDSNVVYSGDLLYRNVRPTTDSVQVTDGYDVMAGRGSWIGQP